MVSSTQPRSIDPMIQPPELPHEGGMDYPAHVRTYNRFVSTLKWFIIHMVPLTTALYFAIIEGNALVAVFFILVSVALLIVGVMRRRPIREDVEHAMHQPPGSTTT